MPGPQDDHARCVGAKRPTVLVAAVAVARASMKPALIASDARSWKRMPARNETAQRLCLRSEALCRATDKRTRRAESRLGKDAAAVVDVGQAGQGYGVRGFAVVAVERCLHLDHFVIGVPDDLPEATVDVINPPRPATLIL